MNFVFEYGGSAGGGNAEYVTPNLTGVIEMDETATSGKVKVLYKEYETVTAGAMALIDDISSMFDWDVKPDQGAYNGVFYKGDIANSKYSGFVITPSSTYPVGQLLWQQGASTAQQSLAFAAHNGASYAQHVNIAAWENGISLCFPDVANIWSNTGADDRIAVTVGVCKSTNAVTGESGWCAFMSEHYGTAYYTTIFGQSTTGTADNSTHYDSASSMSFAVLGPPYFYQSNDVPDDILMPMLFPSAGIPAMYGYCRFGGRLYYKNGNIFIPAE